MSRSLFSSLWTSPLALSINLRKRTRPIFCQYGPQARSITSIYSIPTVVYIMFLPGQILPTHPYKNPFIIPSFLYPQTMSNPCHFPCHPTKKTSPKPPQNLPPPPPQFLKINHIFSPSHFQISPKNPSKISTFFKQELITK